MKDQPIKIPKEGSALAPWLEQHLAGLGLPSLVAQLSRAALSPEQPLSIKDLLGEHQEAVLQHGLAVLPKEKLGRFLASPDSLFDLHELVRTEGGPYWGDLFHKAAQNQPQELKEISIRIYRKLQEGCLRQAREKKAGLKWLCFFLVVILAFTRKNFCRVLLPVGALAGVFFAISLKLGRVSQELSSLSARLEISNQEVSSLSARLKISQRREDRLITQVQDSQRQVERLKAQVQAQQSIAASANAGLAQTDKALPPLKELEEKVQSERGPRLDIDYKIKLTTEPASPGIWEKCQLTVTLTNMSGKPIIFRQPFLKEGCALMSPEADVQVPAGKEMEITYDVMRNSNDPLCPRPEVAIFR